MASTPEFAQYICDILAGLGQVRSRKMFGEYMVYLNDKPIFLLCDNCLFVKILPEVTALLPQGETGCPYEGAKEHYVLDADDHPLVRKAACVLLESLPMSKPRGKKKRPSEKGDAQ